MFTHRTGAAKERLILTARPRCKASGFLSSLMQQGCLEAVRKEVGMDRAKGKLKEAYGAMTGDEAQKGR